MPGTTREARAKLVVAIILLTILTLVLLLTSTPEQSPAQTWTTWGWMLRYRVLPVEEKAALIEIHKDARDSSREQCVACHGDKMDSELPVHRIHLGSELLSGLACHDCHSQVDLSPRGNTVAVRWVDVGFCKTCHSEFTGAKRESHMPGVDLETDCLMCHTGDRAVKHAQPYLPQIIPTSECKGCHGARVLPWTPRHERDDWLQAHGGEALDIGTENCFKCHDFGLKFCDECHKETPPSHLPDWQWRAIHSEKAQADTRVCYACHETSYCKKCHVNHEDGWMSTHPSFVKERGDASCDECHSPSSCSFCHTNHVLLGDSTQTITVP